MLEELPVGRFRFWEETKAGLSFQGRLEPPGAEKMRREGREGTYSLKGKGKGSSQGWQFRREIPEPGQKGLYRRWIWE